MGQQKFVKIHSDITIKLTAGLFYSDLTNSSVYSADKLKIKADWTDLTYLITAGQNTVPVEITEWPTFKALVENGKILVGEKVDVAETKVENAREELITKSKTTKAAKQVELKDIK